MKISRFFDNLANVRKQHCFFKDRLCLKHRFLRKENEQQFHFHFHFPLSKTCEDELPPHVLGSKYKSVSNSWFSQTDQWPGATFCFSRINGKGKFRT